MRGLLALVLLAPLAAASAGAGTAYDGTDEECATETSVLYDCRLVVEARLVATCAAAECVVTLQGHQNTTDDHVLRRVSTTVTITSSWGWSQGRSTCTSLAIGRSPCPIDNEIRHGVAPGACVPVSLVTTYGQLDVERARVQAQETLCRAADGAPAWS